MRVFEAQSTYDKESGEWVEMYYIDGEEVEADDYFEEMENETFDEGECDGDCDNCELNEEDETKECHCLDCTIVDFTSRILETEGCPCCIENVLKDFVVNIAGRFIEYED